MKKSYAAVLLTLMITCMLPCRAKGASNVLEFFFTVESLTPYELVIIVGRHDNANMYTQNMLEQAGLKDLIIESIEASHDNVATAHVSIIVSDGSPTPITEIMTAESFAVDGGSEESGGTDSIFVREGITSANEDTFKENMADDIIKYLMSDDLMADDAEVDLLAAISEAQKLLEGYPDAEKYILIFDTGITTSGFLDMRETDILEGTVEEVLSGIGEGAFADLTGIHIGLWNLGNVSGDQERLNNTVYEQRLADLWTSIIVDKCNGKLLQDKLVCSASVGEAMSDDDGYPLVSPVYFGEGTAGGDEIESDGEMDDEDGSGSESADAPGNEGEESGDSENGDGSKNGNEGSSDSDEEEADAFETFTLHFKANSPEFVDDGEEELLRSHMYEILTYLGSNPDMHLYIVGSIAQTSDDGEMSRSSVAADRAQAVADILTKEYGVTQDRIITIDAGSTVFSWRCADEYPDTAADEEAMANNRLVAVIAESSVDVEELRENGYVG
ncbi:MAG: hypothetical protein LUF35_02760 [Lachnospiraceae bacterium]|nr:hypothetical protein [Lachnospiraceae bacterium]